MTRLILKRSRRHSKHRIPPFFPVILLVLLTACLIATTHSAVSQKISPSVTQPTSRSQYSRAIDDGDLVDIRRINPRIALDIRYATKHNFTRRTLYPQARCILRRTVAERLSRVQADLEERGFGLKVYDCYRPLSVQKQMWKLVPDDRYVANPAQGSRHNRGSAVDLTLVTSQGDELEMPTGFDDFSERAHINATNVSAKARYHRQVLQQAMKQQGFLPLTTEWWHFDDPNWKQYPVMDVPLDGIP